MAKLNRIAMELLRTSNKPENIKGIADKGYAYDYADYLINVGDELPEIIVKWLAEKGNPNKTIALVLKMKAKDLEVADGLMENISKDPFQAAAYAIEKYDYDPESEMEPEIYESIIKSAGAIKEFVTEFLKKDIDVSLFSLDQWNHLIENMQSYIGIEQLSYALAKKLIESGLIKNYKQINKRLIQSITKNENTTNKFAHFLLPYVKELPEEIKSKVTNQNILKPDWRKVTKFEESFSNFFKGK